MRPMAKDTTYVQLQEEYGGKFIATLRKKVVASADTFKELIELLKKAKLDEREIVFEYIDPKGVAVVY